MVRRFARSARLAGVTSLALATVAVSGCAPTGHSSHSATSIAPLHRQWIEEHRAFPDVTDLQLAILEDYWVSSEELELINAADRECSAPFVIPGHTFEEDRHGRRTWNSPTEEHARSLERMDAKCGHVRGMIHIFYHEMRINPNADTPVEQVRQCLAAAGSGAAAEMSEDEFTSHLLDPQWRSANAEMLECGDIVLDFGDTPSP